MAFALPVATEIRGFHGTTPVPIDAAAASLAPVCCISGRRPIPALRLPEHWRCPFEHFPDYIAAAPTAGTLRPVSFPSGYTGFGHFKLSFWHYYL